MYSLLDYGHMIADRVRMDPYVYALKGAVGPDSIVLDIGTATGIHALLAAKFGAKKVYAVEENEAVHLAKETALANGFADKIEFIQGLSTGITLPAKADIIVSDLRGTLPLFNEHINTIVDARRRHLAPGGLLIPQKDTLWVALVEKPSIYRDIVKPWDFPYGLTMSAARNKAVNSWNGDNTGEIKARDLLTKPKRWAVLDYLQITNPTVACENILVTATRSGTAHGWLVWFDAEIGPGFGFSNAPKEDRIAEVYGRGFFPLFEPIHLTEGDSITLDLLAEYGDGGYAWTWRTQTFDSSDLSIVKTQFEQSTVGLNE